MKKRDLWMLAIALVSVLFLVILFAAAKTSKNSASNDSLKPAAMEEAEAEVETENPLEVPEQKNTFEFSAGEFAKTFEGNLPQGYVFEKNITVNAQGDHRIQLDILNESGTSIDMAILFDTENAEDACSQMALVMKADCSADDIDSILKWYLFNFLNSFTVEKKKAVYDDYLYMFDTGTEDFRVYSEDNQTVMMCCETEESDKYYYVLISVEPI